MNIVPLGKSELTSSRLAYGCWRLAGTGAPAVVTDADRTAGKAAAIAAYDAGYTLFDHADVYGEGVAEEIFGDVLREVSGMRERIVIASKCGIRFAGHPAGAPYRYDFTKEHITWSCEQSLRRLGVETIDLYQLHRPDLLADWYEVADAFSALKESGKVREFGVSNFRPSQVSALQAAVGFPILVNQVQISLMNLDCFDDGTLDQCQERRITPLAWSPLGGGRLMSAEFATSALAQTIDEIASRHGTTPSNIAFAWLLMHPSEIIPIVGSTNPMRIREAVVAQEIMLTREEWYTLLEASRGARLP